MRIVPVNLKTYQIEIWFQDETRVGQQGSLTRIWAVKEQDQDIVRQQQFLSAYIYGAVCPQRQVGAALDYAVYNSACMNQHLAELSTQVIEGNHAVVIIDQARWHTSRH